MWHVARMRPAAKEAKEAKEAKPKESPRQALAICLSAFVGHLSDICRMAMDNDG